MLFLAAAIVRLLCIALQNNRRRLARVLRSLCGTQPRPHGYYPYYVEHAVSSRACNLSPFSRINLTCDPRNWVNEIVEGGRELPA